MNILPLNLLSLRLPSVHANAGIPLLWFALIHLYFGNFFIAIFEWFLLWVGKKTRKFFIPAILLIVANYVSMFIGLNLAFLLSDRMGFDLYNPQGWSVYYYQNLLYYFGFTIASMLIEFPFFSFILRRFSFKQRVKITVVINFISALIVIICNLLFQYDYYGTILGL